MHDLLGYVPLTEPIMKVMAGIPKVLPEAFWNVTERVMGDTARNVTFRGTRKVARVAPYGAPPRQTLKLSAGVEPTKLIHSIENQPVGMELYHALQQFDTYAPMQQFCKDEINRQGEQFALRFLNLRTAAVGLMIANSGKLWFDSEGNIQTTSSGADLTIDPGVSANNIGSCNSIISAPWSTVTTDIPTQVNNLKTAAIQSTGYPLKYAIHGKNVAGYLAKNTYFKEYLARNPGYNQAYLNTGQIPAGTLGLTWIPAQDLFFEDSTGTVQSYFDGDQVTFCPEIDSRVYAMYEGTYPVPKSFAFANSATDVLNPGNIEYKQGAFQYAWMNPALPLKIEFVAGDTFLPRLKVPNAFFFADTTP